MADNDEIMLAIGQLQGKVDALQGDVQEIKTNCNAACGTGTNRSVLTSATVGGGGVAAIGIGLLKLIERFAQ